MQILGNWDVVQVCMYRLGEKIGCSLGIFSIFTESKHFYSGASRSHEDLACFGLKLEYIMAPRNIFYASPLPEFHNAHLLNPPNANPQRHIESTMLGSNEHTMMNHNVNFPHPNTTNSGAICDNYHHQNMPYQAQNAPYCYHQHANQTGATAMAYPPAENSRMPFKRKTPAHPVYENPYGHQFTGSSSNFPVPSNRLQLNPMPVFSRPLHPNGSIYRYQDETLLSFGEEYQRNVRIRHSNAPQEDLNHPSWQSSSSRTLLLPPSSSMSAATFVGGQWHHTSSLPGSFSQWTHPTSAHGTWGGPASYDQRLVLNRTSSNYTNLAAGQGNGPSGTGSVSSSRIPRLTNLQIGSTNRVPRNFNAGWPRGWTSQGFSTTDVRYSAYALDLFDEHRDMRLNIDSMSYEELLMLEETIGNVNTGLSEDSLSRCLAEQICSSTSAQDDQDEASCPICLEEFEDKDRRGVMKCRHVYHLACIKEWLGLKKTCPVCKAPAMDDDAKQEQKVSL